MIQTEIHRDYFEWLQDIVCTQRFSKDISYKNLLLYLHNIPFRYSIDNDKNRFEDGISLRHRFGYSYRGPCSVLEMLVALAIRCEKDIMDDFDMGDRTSQWFWQMIVNMGIGSMDDDRYDEKVVKKAVDTFLDRQYEPDGTGGLFTVKNCEYDLRTVEIWNQMLWYLDNIN